MEAASLVVAALVVGAATAAGDHLVGAVIKDAYDALKRKIKARYPSVPIDLVENYAVLLDQVGRGEEAAALRERAHAIQPRR